jgi:hypothetical protein
MEGGSRMIDTDKYEELLENGMQHRDLWELAAELLAEVKRLCEGIEKALIPTDSNPIIHPLVKLSDLRDALKELIK